MGVTTEEAKAKLSLDVSTLDAGKTKIGEFGEHAHRSFLHAGSPARRFHKIMEEITDKAPALGQAITLAINPLVGVLGAVGAGFAFVNKQIEEMNKHLDETRDKTVKPITNQDAINDAIRSRQISTSEGSRDFDRKERGKIPILSGLTEMQQTVLSGMAPGAQRDAMERSFIGAARQRLLGELGKTQRARESDEGAVGDPNLQAAIERRKQMLAHTQREMEDLERKKGELQESAATPTLRTSTLKEWALGLAGFMTGRPDIAPRAGLDTDARKREEANQELERLSKLKEESKKLQEQLRELTEYDKKNNDELKNKKENISKLIDAIRELDKEYGKIPVGPNPLTPVTAPTIDPSTGGIAYRPVKDLGGIKYRPLPGAMGFQPLVPTVPANLAEKDPIWLLNEKMAELVKAATDSGLILRLPE